MLIGQVIGNVVSTCKEENLLGAKLLVVEVCDEEGVVKSVIAVDAVGAGVGEKVLVLIEGGSARLTVNNPQAPINTVIAGIIDIVSINQ